ncbi:MAG: TonB-dependent receptor [Bacteroidales bacterium]|nr:TonB-dependent receptor [Bacteroidales bacterium]
MKKILLLLPGLILMIFVSGNLLAQELKITGTVIDGNTNETIPGISIRVEGTTVGTLTGNDGTFELNLNTEKAGLQFTHISYKPFRYEVYRKPGQSINIGVIPLEPIVIELEGVKIISSFVTERNTPVAISNIKSRTIEQKTGNQDYPEILKMTPGIYATKEGGGSGDDRLSLRGFQQENVSLLLNGVPVSSMENGLVYWSNWTGLTDATEAIQVQRGLGASRVAMNSVGGTINIITKSTSAVAGGALRYSISDYGNSKTTMSFSTGKMKNGTSLTFLGSHTVGPGYVDATYVNGWAYFLSLSREFGKKHRLVLTAMGAPEKHGQRNYGMSQADFEKFGVKYNKNWGEYNGEILSLSENFYHKPQINLNHYWNITPKAFLATSAYVSFGNGGGKYTEVFNYGKPTWDYRKNNQIDFDAVFLANSTNTDSTTLADGSVVKGYSKNILTNYKANHYWVGLLSSLTLDVNDNFKVTTGIHLRNFKSHLYEEVDELMGGNFWVEQYAWSLAGVSGRDQVKKPGDVINVDNYSMISYGNVFGQAEYKIGKLTTFVASTLSGTHYRREDPYNYPENPLSEPVNKAGFDGKGGAGYKVGKYGNVYGNVGFYSREPYYKFVYVNFSNNIAKDLVNEKITSAEAGYTYESGKITTRINLYYTLWKDKSLLSRENIQLADSTLTRSLVRGLNALHQGIEAEFSYKVLQNLTLAATASFGNWKWQNDVSASIYNDNQVLVDSMMVYTKGLYVGDAPQTQLGFSAEYHTGDAFRFSADWVFYDRLYANFDPVNRNNAEDDSQPYKIPAYSLFDLYAGYDFQVKQFPVSMQFACQNLLNKQTIIRGDDGAGHDLETFSGFWSLGRTFNISAKISF